MKQTIHLINYTDTHATIALDPTDIYCHCITLSPGSIHVHFLSFCLSDLCVNWKEITDVRMQSLASTESGNCTHFVGYAYCPDLCAHSCELDQLATYALTDVSQSINQLCLHWGTASFPVIHATTF